MIAENDPAEQEKSVKWNSLLCNLIVFHTAIDMMEVIRQLVAEGVAAPLLSCETGWPRRTDRTRC